MSADLQESRTHRFAYNRWAARRTAALMMIILYSFLLWLILGQQSRLNSWFELVVVVAAAAVALVYVILANYPVTRLSVGPAGVSIPYGLARDVDWSEIEKVEYVAKQSPLMSPRHYLVFFVTNEAPPLARLSLPEVAEKWLYGKRITVPLHILRAEPTEVISAVNAYQHVIETDLESVKIDAEPAE